MEKQCPNNAFLQLKKKVSIAMEESLSLWDAAMKGQGGREANVVLYRVYSELVYSV